MCLPARDHFVNSLTESPILDAEYAHAQRLWSAFNMRTFSDYYDLYLLFDVLLLADVFKSFQDRALRDYRIDPCNFYSLLGSAWDAMLKMTVVRLELLTNIDQHLLDETGVD